MIRQKGNDDTQEGESRGRNSHQNNDSQQTSVQTIDKLMFKRMPTK